MSIHADEQMHTNPSDNADGAAGDTYESLVDALGDDGEEAVEVEAQDDEEGLEDEEAEGGEQDAAEEKPSAKRRLKVGDEELDEEEVVAGFMKGRDYTQKTQALAEQRRMIEAHAQQVAQEREYHATRLEVLIGGLHAELQGVRPDELQKLLDTDPKAYLKAREHIEQKQNLLQQAVAERHALQQRAIAEQSQRRQQYLAEQREALVEKLPEWRDPKKAEAETREITKFLVAEGYQPHELNDLLDHRALVIARKALLFDKQQAARKANPTPQPKPGAVVRPGAPAPNRSANQVRVVRAAERLKSAPDSLDALAGFVGASGG